MTDKEAQLAVSDYNLQKLNTKEFSKHVAATIQMGGNLAVFGRRGTGKTEISKQEIAKSGDREVYLNLSVMERVDLGGYPDIMGVSAEEKRRKFVDFLLPRFYEALIDGDKPVTLLLDEMDKAEPALWAPLLEITQFRSINHRPLPNLHSIIMTGNLISEGGMRPSLPLLDRSEKYLLEASSDLWLSWAGSMGNIHPSITAYIYDHPNDLFGSVDPEDRYADASPRGWDRSSNIVRKGEENGWSASILNAKVSGCIGKSVGTKYEFYFQYYIELMPLIERIFNGENVADEYNSLEPTKKLVACMITCARFANKLDEAGAGNMPKCWKNVGTFLQMVESENTLISVRSQIQIERIIRHNLDDVDFWKKIISSINEKVND